MALPPGHVCFTRPARKHPRKFKEKDLKRIAKYLQRDGISPLKILGIIAGVLGLGWLVCLAARTLDNTLTISRFIAKVGGILAFSKIIDFLLTVVTSGAFKRLARVFRFASILILAVGVLEGISRAIKQIVSDADKIENISRYLHDVCDAAKEAAQDAGNFIGEEFGDISESVIDQVSDLPEQLDEIGGSISGVFDSAIDSAEDLIEDIGDAINQLKNR